jgi:hypothetical protein
VARVSLERPGVRGLKSTVADALVLLVAAYLQAAVLVRCARVALEPVPRFDVGHDGLPEPAAAPELPRETPFSSRTESGPAPLCAGLAASIVTASRDAEFSLATLRSERGVRLVRQGSQVDGLTVAAIGERELVLSNESRSCRVPLGASPAPSRPDAAPEAGVVRAPRSLREAVLAHPERLLRGARVVPERMNGAISAFLIERLAPGALLETLGLRSGDRIRSVNGFTLNRPRDAVQAWAALSRAESFEIAIDRAGKPIALHVRLD